MNAVADAWLRESETLCYPVHRGEDAVRLAIVVEGHPVPQGSLSHARGGHAYWPARVKRWREHIAREASREMRASALPLFDGRCSVGLRFYMRATKGGARPGRLIGDLDKLVRAVLDACTGIVWPDDEVVVNLLASKQPVEANGIERCELTVFLPSVTKC